MRFLSDEDAEDHNTQREFERAEMDRDDEGWAHDLEYDVAWGHR